MNVSANLLEERANKYDCVKLEDYILHFALSLAVGH